MSDNQLLEVIERYLNDDMDAGERTKFELLCKENADINSRVKEHQQFTKLLKQYAERVALEDRLNAIHNEIDVHTLKEDLMVHPSWVIQLWRQHHSKISVAATVALFIMVSVMYFTGSFNSTSTKVELLDNKVDRQSRSIESLSRSIHAMNKTQMDKYSATGTGFAITADGLIATNYHVVKIADSIHVENVDGTSFKAEILYSDPQNDIAILKIVDNTFKQLDAIPYTFKRSESDLAENISTYGYPDGQPAWHNGYLSAKTGLKGDTVRYKISIPINPGNSGGPLWDSKGNVVGITDSKQAQAEGEHFAIKARYLLDAIHNIPADSLNQKVSLNKKNTLSGLTDVQRVKKEKQFVFMVKTYN